jgi:hypothetical protein
LQHSSPGPQSEVNMQAIGMPLPVDTVLVDAEELAETPVDEAELPGPELLLEELPGPVDDTALAAVTLPPLEALPPPAAAALEDLLLPQLSPPWPPCPDVDGVQSSTPMTCPHPTAAATTEMTPTAMLVQSVVRGPPCFKLVFTELIGVE